VSTSNAIAQGLPRKNARPWLHLSPRCNTSTAFFGGALN
jgi:hypothetical protein